MKKIMIVAALVAFNPACFANFIVEDISARDLAISIARAPSPDQNCILTSDFNAQAPMRQITFSLRAANQTTSVTLSLEEKFTYTYDTESREMEITGHKIDVIGIDWITVKSFAVDALRCSP